MPKYTLEEKNIIRKYLLEQIKFCKVIKTDAMQEFAVQMLKERGEDLNNNEEHFMQFSKEITDTMERYFGLLLRQLI